MTTSRYVDVVAWNAKTGRDPDDVAAAVGEILDLRPHLLEVSEAAEYRTVIARAARRHGYAVRQLERAPRRRRRLEEDANLAVLVRADVGVASARPWRMRFRWTGPVHRWPHQPRVYWRALVVVRGLPAIRASFGHWPTLRPRRNAAACRETERRVRVWFRLSAKPAFHVGDLNRSASWLRKHFPGLRVIVGRGPDHALTNKHLNGSADVLGKYGSDHHAIRYRFRLVRSKGTPS